MLKKMFQLYDYSIVVTVLLLGLFGVVMVYSSSMVIAVSHYEYDANFFFIKQRMWFILSSMVFFITMILPYRIYFKLFKIIAMGSIGMLILVYLVGHTANNAQSWIAIGGFRLQPGEFVKIGVIIYLAAIFSKKQKYIDDFGTAVIPPLVFTIIIFTLVFFQPDLGTAVLIAMIAVIMTLSSGMNMKNVMKLLGLGALALVILIPSAGKLLSDEQLSRFGAAYDPFADPQDSGMQLINSYIAIAEGGITGLGLGNSVQKTGFLPESHTDFIMAIISEELGIFGVGFVILCLSYIVLKGFMLARKCDDSFGSLLAIGISAMIGVQACVNLGALTGLLPVTGVPLPFVSYGGSSMLALMASTGILVNISMFNNYRKQKLSLDEIAA
ncbi:FtsW/RodA/SpoVE family cell cycle protein [Bacillus suaedaesalsae]|uniref:Probable peptidoglycan glycosyltransferase FtsW n=1 Tax=Bacillus suaedaesalsae TaxID=2810349 RepID=A0ABS2DJL6_9BACI|nr:FtsW/RodA/SpoVE family cell cycle protein [Bacillus suaedaesalsae]MBM6618597.1 FtsW/RodA/SpoVE family cell cycle protein [Bacillus suaedaesalsae]